MSLLYPSTRHSSTYSPLSLFDDPFSVVPFQNSSKNKSRRKPSGLFETIVPIKKRLVLTDAVLNATIRMPYRCADIEWLYKFGHILEPRGNGTLRDTTILVGEFCSTHFPGYKPDLKQYRSSVLRSGIFSKIVFLCLLYDAICGLND